MGQPLTVQEQKRVNEAIGMQDEAAAVEALERNFDSHVLDASSLSLVEGAWKLIAAHAGPLPRTPASKTNLASQESDRVKSAQDLGRSRPQRGPSESE